jgi:hypothetical protein
MKDMKKTRDFVAAGRPSSFLQPQVVRRTRHLQRGRHDLDALRDRNGFRPFVYRALQ